MSEDLVTRFLRAAGERPDAVAVIDPDGRTTTFGELRRLALKADAGLRAAAGVLSRSPAVGGQLHMNEDLVTRFLRAAGERPDAVAVIDPDGRTTTFGELRRLALEACAGLRAAIGVLFPAYRCLEVSA